MHDSLNASANSVHSFFASPNVNVTTVVTVTFLQDSKTLATQVENFAVGQPTQRVQSMRRPADAADNLRRAGTSAGPPSALPPAFQEAGFFSGRDW